MSWHPSVASTEALDPAAPSRYRSAIVRSCAGRSMLVETEDGDERLVPVPSASGDALVGTHVLLAGDGDWVVAVEPADPAEALVIDLGGRRVTMGQRSAPPTIDLRPRAATDPDALRPTSSGRRGYLFGRRRSRRAS